MALDFLIIADDLTGAADTAAQFSKQDIPAAVYVSADTEFDTSFHVAAVTTETRHCRPQEAFQKVKTTVEKALAAGRGKFYKKIDSTFRGNVGAELDALMTAAGVRHLALVPAYPAAGRTTRGGYQYVSGELLHRSAFARDPREPAAESFIPAILEKQTARPVRLAGIAGDGKGDGVIVYDAGSDDELRRVAAELEKSGGLDVAAGAAGFAAMIAERYARWKRKKKYPGKKRKRNGPLFVVNGSLNDISLGQVEQARREGVVCHVSSSDADIEHLADAIARNLREDGCAVFTTGAPGRVPEHSSCSAADLGRIAAAVIGAVPEAAVAVFGGDTASAVCRGLRRKVLYPGGEIMPGLTVCSAGSPSGPEMILKSGGFGSEDIIRKIRNHIKVQ